MSERDQKLSALNSPDNSKTTPGFAMDSVVVHGNTLYLSGQVAFKAEGELLKGKVGETISLEQAQAEAAQCAANLLQVIKEKFGTLDVIDRILKLTVFVNAVDDYTEQPQVGNAASQLFIDVLGDAGRHARSAIGVGSLPLGVPVEIEMIAALKS